MRAATPAAPARTPARPGARVGTAQDLPLVDAAALDDEALAAAEEPDDEALLRAAEALELTEERAELALLTMLETLVEAAGKEVELLAALIAMPAWAMELVPD